MDITGRVVSTKPTTRIKIVGRFANRKACDYKKHASPKPKTDSRSHSPETSLASDAFMEEYLRFPSPCDDAIPTLSVDNRSIEERISGKDSLDLFSENDSLYEHPSVRHDVCPHASAVPAGTTRFPGADESYQGDQDHGVDAYLKGQMHGRGTSPVCRSGSALVSPVSATSESAAAAASASAPARRQTRIRLINRLSKANTVSGLQDVRPPKRRMIGLRGARVHEAETNNDRTQGTSSVGRESNSPEFEAFCIVVVFH